MKSLRSVNLKSFANYIGLIKGLEQDRQISVKNYLKENLVGDINQDINMNNLFNKLNEFYRN